MRSPVSIIPLTPASCSGSLATSGRETVFNTPTVSWAFAPSFDFRFFVKRTLLPQPQKQYAATVPDCSRSRARVSRIVRRDAAFKTGVRENPEWERGDGRCRARTCDLLLVRQAL